VVDGTGLKVFGDGEWKMRQHGVSKRRTWRKVHLAVDQETGYVRAAATTGNGVGDGQMLPGLLEQVGQPIRQVSADGVYDTRACYEAIAGRAKWERESGYHRRSLAETAVFRLKAIFGPALRARGEAAQDTETMLRIDALNRMTALGMPQSYAA
jgi:hypothetical protein